MCALPTPYDHWLWLDVRGIVAVVTACEVSDVTVFRTVKKVPKQQHGYSAKQLLRIQLACSVIKEVVIKAARLYSQEGKKDMVLYRFPIIYCKC